MLGIHILMRMNYSAWSRSVIALFLIFLFGAFNSGAQDAGENLLSGIRAQLKDPTKPFTLVIKLFGVAMKATRKEKGCLAYDLNRPQEGGNEYVVYEKWANLEAIRSHVQSAYITKLLSQLPDLTEGAPSITFLVPAGE